MKYIAYFTLVMLIGYDIQAGEVPPTTNVDPAPVTEPQVLEVTAPRANLVNHEARTAEPIFVTEAPTVTEVVTKTMAMPAGYQMVEVAHASLWACTEYPQPSTWEIQPIAQPVAAQPVVVGEGNVDSITLITGE